MKLAEVAATLARLAEWTRDPSEHVRRLVSEVKTRLPRVGIRMFSARGEEVFGAKPRAAGGTFLVADLPGVALNFSPSPDPVIGTTGRSMEHIGFEVKDLEAFCKRLEAMGIKLSVTYRRAEALGLGVAFVTDPWGTSIELNEGLDKLN